jgi:hypothetical protein
MPSQRAGRGGSVQPERKRPPDERDFQPLPVLRFNQ